jgi:hypothetical protein
VSKTHTASRRAGIKSAGDVAHPVGFFDKANMNAVIHMVSASDRTNGFLLVRIKTDDGCPIFWRNICR